MSVTVRRATEHDVDFIVSELLQFSEFMDTRLKLFDAPEYATQGIRNAVKEHVVFVAESSGDPDEGVFQRIGFILATLGPHPFNPRITVLSEMFWWVKKEHRGTRAGAMLLRYLIEFGKQKADWIAVSLEAKSPVKPDALLSRGFKLLETGYLMEVTK